MVRILGYFMIFTVPALIFFVFFAITSYVALLAFAITLTVMAFVATIFLCIKYTIVPCVYFEDESISNEEIIKLGLNFISDKLNDCRKILLSFLPYILLPNQVYIAELQQADILKKFSSCSYHRHKVC